MPLVGLEDFEGLPLTLVYFLTLLASSCVVRLDLFLGVPSTCLVDLGSLVFPLPVVFWDLLFFTPWERSGFPAGPPRLRYKFVCFCCGQSSSLVRIGFGRDECSIGDCMGALSSIKASALCITALGITSHKVLALHIVAPNVLLIQLFTSVLLISSMNDIT